MYEYRCKIVRVVDGDTVDVDIDLGFGVWLQKQRVRLYGVDTPESRTRDAEEKVFGNLAKKFVEDRLPVDSKQKLRTRLDGKGKFGRILGEFLIYDPKTDRESTINQMLIETSNAVAYHGQSKEEIEKEHLENRVKLGAEAYLGG
tara:strand:- start:1051 stop:1485 length:435 start_codon:yes stop_codon:yes gene_type:complete